MARSNVVRSITIAFANNFPSLIQSHQYRELGASHLSVSKVPLIQLG
jgi:hypothetical protein